MVCLPSLCCSILQYYLANDQKLKKYVPLIKDSLVYPVIYDADRTLLSLPPIINGAATAVSQHDCKQAQQAGQQASTAPATGQQAQQQQQQCICIGLYCA